VETIVTPREEHAKKTIPSGKTLNDLAKEYDLPDWQEIALCNWGTAEPAEVRRLLFEYIGWEQPGADPGRIVLKPHNNANREILLPKCWEKEEKKRDKSLGLDKTHTIKVRVAPAPPVAISINTLSRWFIPGLESCDLTYSLEGLAKNAVKVDLEVYGSNYCTAGAWNNGFVNFAAADLKDTKLYEKAEQTSAPERKSGLAIAEWKGKVTASAGALGKKDPGNKDRVINVAFSPYTAVLRYYKDDGDKAARLELDAFWPQFDDTGAAVADSLKIRFAVRGSDRIKSTNGGGTLLVVDGAGEVVFREPISLANLGKKDAGFNEVAWTGDYSPNTKQNSKGGAKTIAADMPYRVQVQVHTGPDQANGLALAAMSTEVRLYVHPQTHPQTLDPYEPETDKPSFAFQSTRSLLALKEKIVRADGALWIRHQLARAGFHPGPVENPVDDVYKIARNEFKRSIPQHQARLSDPFVRFAMDTSEGDDVKDAIEDLELARSRHRCWFGDPADCGDYRPDSDELATQLNDPAKGLIVWVDDRHYYTNDPSLDSAGPKGPSIRQKTIKDPAAMGNYALTMVLGDAAIDEKAKWIPRPWIPLSVSLTLMSKDKGLADEIGAPSEADGKLMAKAIGPLRVDWSFFEIDATPPVEAPIDTARYDKQVSRSKIYVETARDDNKSAAHARKDVKLQATYTNTPDTCGGIRPAANADYYKAMYAQVDQSLRPWRAEPDSTFETIVTIVHDNVGQADDSIFTKRCGSAGIYFRPSTVGGDGMRLRAQVRFKKLGGYDFANLPVLEKRYSLLPQAQSAGIRVWRKASIRSYVYWGSPNSWGAQKDDLFGHYKGGCLHFVFENDDSSVASSIAHYFDPYFNDKKKLVGLVREAVDGSLFAAKADKQRAAEGNIALDDQHFWPWHDAPHFGVFEPSDPGSDKSNAVHKFHDILDNYFNCLSSLYGLELAKAIEAGDGKLRGHIVVHFDQGKNFFVQQYQCRLCSKKFFYVEKDARGDSMARQWCPACLIGTFQRCDPVGQGYYTCTNGHKNNWAENTLAGGAFTGYNCPADGCVGPGTLAPDQVARTRYGCNKCDFTFDFPDGTDHSGESCYKATCSGKLGVLYTEVYTCSKCNADVNLTESSAGAYEGEKHAGCPQSSWLSPSALQRKASPVVTAITGNGNRVELSHASPSGYLSTGLPVSSMGNALGVAWNFGPEAALWAHELGHTRYMQHAANAGGAANDQHDHEANTVFNFVNIHETVAESQMWDRACLMSYVNHLTTYDNNRDRPNMCGKCVLKTRGWKLASVTDPGGGVQDP